MKSWVVIYMLKKVEKLETEEDCFFSKRMTFETQPD